MDDDGIDDDLELSHIPTKKMKITAANTVQKRPECLEIHFLLGQTLPLTKVAFNQRFTDTCHKRSHSSVEPTPKESVFSPLEGKKRTINNLHPRVTEEDIFAEVVFIRKEDAVGAYKKYNNRYLDEQPMKCKSSFEW
ncbi:unnamed protein product [Ranitomeya imitator]|uniref:Uncharacterized protein n=1 Tax=Ranitomeya imitator TaxID=111125 RepID=A0ABN9LZV1_9NEOB|nr:unnamed protein product [Ranitomeya imitator]